MLILIFGDKPVNEITLESLAQRIEAIERTLKLKPPHPDKNAWQAVVGMFADTDFMRQVDEEGRKIREAERAEAQKEQVSE